MVLLCGCGPYSSGFYLVVSIPFIRAASLKLITVLLGTCQKLSCERIIYISFGWQTCTFQIQWLPWTSQIRVIYPLRPILCLIC